MPNFGTRKRKVYHMCTTKWGEKTSISTHFSRLWYSFGTRIAICGTPFSGCTTSETIIIYNFNRIFFRYGKCTDNKSDILPQKDCNGCQESLCRNRSVLYNRERTRISTRVSVLKHFRLKRQTYETYLHIITSHLVSVKIC